MDTEVIKEHIAALLPNREKVRHFIWDSHSGKLSQKLDEYLVSKIEEYGSWKEKKRADGTIAYKGWIYKQKKQGHWVYQYKNGKPHKDCFYRDNEYHGVCTFWEVDGSYEVNKYYKGRLNGERLRYNADGIIFQKWVYEMGHSKEFYGPVELGLYEKP